MRDGTVETALLVAASALLAGGQVTLWWRAARHDPQATSIAVLTQASALTVLALYCWQAGLRVVGGALWLLAAASGAGLVSAALTVARHAREHGTTWWAAHRRGLRRTLVVTESVLAVVALATVLTWAQDTAGDQYQRDARVTVCKLLEGGC